MPVNEIETVEEVTIGLDLRKVHPIASRECLLLLEADNLCRQQQLDSHSWPSCLQVYEGSWNVAKDGDIQECVEQAG